MADPNAASLDPARLDEFVQTHLRLAPVPHVPELVLYQTELAIGLWELTEGEYRSEAPPPFWAFAWAGGQGLARYVLDHPAEVAGRDVLDLASGSGLVAIAAARAGAASARAVDIDQLGGAAIALNARANAVEVTVTIDDVLDRSVTEVLGAAWDPAGPTPLVLAGDVFYSKVMADRMLTFARRAAREGCDVLVGDPGRAYFPRDYFTPLATADVPVPRELESTDVRSVTVWRINPRGAVAHRAGKAPDQASTPPHEPD
jgi:predicted nicotinamide N-methyase